MNWIEDFGDKSQTMANHQFVKQLLFKPNNDYWNEVIEIRAKNQTEGESKWIIEKRKYFPTKGVERVP